MEAATGDCRAVGIPLRMRMKARYSEEILTPYSKGNSLFRVVYLLILSLRTVFTPQFGLNARSRSCSRQKKVISVSLSAEKKSLTTERGFSGTITGVSEGDNKKDAVMSS